MLNQTGIVLQTVMYLLSLRPELQGVNVTEANSPPPAIKRVVPPRFFEDRRPINHHRMGSSEDHKTRCYPEPHGCFSIAPPWDSHRPVAYFPEAPDKVNPGFCLYTKDTQEDCRPLFLNDKKSIFSSPIKSEHKTFFIIHGYLESGNKTWIKHMSRELLRAHRDANVIAVDWMAGSGPPYAQAVANTRIVGRTVALMINLLREEIGLRVEETHIIGHSLGSHTAGYAGYALQTEWGHQLGRITGLDPAEPHFVDTEPLVRLDPEDARFVDVVHTDASPFIAGGFGLRQPVGHLDFYPNGGEFQPGCDNNVFDSINYERGSLLMGIRRALGCNHVRSYEFFTESINSACEFTAVECDSWLKFESGECFSCPAENFYNTKPACVKFGFRAQPVPPRKHVQLYFKTAAHLPFCRNHYRVEIEISNSSRSFAHGGEVGEFWIELKGETGSTERIRVNEGASYFEPGARRRRVVAGGPVGHLISATIEWDYRSSMWNPLTWRFLATPQIFLERLSVDVLETGQKLHLCTGNDPLLSSQPKTFTRHQECQQPQRHAPKH